MAWKQGTAADHEDLLTKISDFATKGFKAGAVTAGGGNTGDGIVYGASATEHSVAETWTLTCTLAGGDEVATFSVSGSVTGALASATAASPYSEDEVSFIILGGDTDYALGDSFTFDVVSATPEWEVLEEDLVSAQKYVLLKGIGSGSDEVFIGYRTQSDGTTYFNLEVSVFSGFVNGNSYDDQPGIHSYYFCASNASFNYTILMSGRSIRAVAELGIVNEHGYAGWFLPNATPSQYRYPAFVGGNTDDSSQLIGGTEDDHTAYWNAYSDEYSGAVQDGVSWVEINRLIPKSYASSDTWQPDLRGDRTLYPCEVLSESAFSIYGRLEGVYFVTNGDSAVTVGDVILVGENAYICFQDAFRTGTTNVIALDLIGDI